jgi:hypothetical protein
MRDRSMLTIGMMLWLVTSTGGVSDGAEGASFRVGLNTKPLIGHPAGPFSLVLVVTDGSGIGEANNTVTVSDVDLGGGSTLGAPLLLGGASGGLATVVTITDGAFLNLFSEAFEPGNTLRFTLSMTTNDNEGETPDRFALSIVDGSGTPIATLAPAGDFLLGIDLSSRGGAPEVHRGDASRPPFAGGSIALRKPRFAPALHRPR